MSLKQLRAIAFIVIGAISIICKFSLGEYGADYYNDVLFAIGSILLVGGLTLITIGATTLLEIQQNQNNQNNQNNCIQ